MSHPGSQGCDIFYANFIQWAHEGGNCYSTIKLYCNLLKAALVWASRHGCLLSQTYNVMRCPTEAEVRKCSGHKSMKTFERYITFDED